MLLNILRTKVQLAAALNTPYAIEIKTLLNSKHPNASLSDSIKLNQRATFTISRHLGLASLQSTTESNTTISSLIIGL